MCSSDLVRLITPDLPGFGAGRLPDPAPSTLSVGSLIEWLERSLLEHAPGRVVLGGVAVMAFTMLIGKLFGSTIA